MRRIVSLPIFQAIGIVTAAHAVLCYALAGVDGLRENAVLAVSLVVSTYLSKATTLKAHWFWLRSYQEQFWIWVICSACMALFTVYRSGSGFAVAIAEALTVASFFMAMVSIGNRVLK